MARHPVSFAPSGRVVMVEDRATILDAALAAGEPVAAECAGRGACGRCLCRVLSGAVPAACVQRREAGATLVLACQTPVLGPLTLMPLGDLELPRLASLERWVGVAPLAAFAPFPADSLTFALDPIATAPGHDDLGVALDIGTTTLKLLLVRLRDGVVIGEAGAYNPQIPRGADVISRIVAAEKGLLGELSAMVRRAVRDLLEEATLVAAGAGLGAPLARIRAYVVAGNLTMIHLLLGVDPAGIRRVPAEPAALCFGPILAAALGWPGDGALVHCLPAAGAWVGGDILAGLVRAGFSRQAVTTQAGAPAQAGAQADGEAAPDGLSLYVDLGTNGEIALGGPDFALVCACSAGPAFEGGGIRCGMRADSGAIDGGHIDVESGALEVSVVSGAPARGVCGSGLIALCEALFRAGWIDRAARLTEQPPPGRLVSGAWGKGVSLTPGGDVVLLERDLASLLRAKAAVLSGILSLHGSLGPDTGPLARVIVSGNFGRFLNLPAALGIGLLPHIPLERFGYVGNGSLEGAALALLSRGFAAEVDAYLRRVTYVNLSELPGYMDELVAASFLPHTSPERLCL